MLHPSRHPSLPSPSAYTRRVLFQARRSSRVMAQQLLQVWRQPLNRAETVKYLSRYTAYSHLSAPLPISTYCSPVQAETALRLDVLNNSGGQKESDIDFEPDQVWDIPLGGPVHQLALTSSGTPLINGRTLLDLDYGTVAGFKDLPIKPRHQHYPVVIAPWSHFFGRYYTFTLWLLTKLCRMQQVLAPTLWRSAKFCYPRFNTAYETQYLEKLGIPLENVIDTRPYNLKISTDRLILANNQTCVNRISPADVALLRDRFLPPQALSPSRKLFFPRRGRRILKNETELQAILEQQGFETVEDTGRTVDEQIALFQSASHIVAVHGAGLSNLVWCNPGTHIVELFYRGYTKPGFYYLAKLLGLNYDCLFDRSTATDSFSNQFCDLDIDPADLKALLARLH